MDRYVANPDWRHGITWYFFLGGVAAGSAALSALATLFGKESDRRATRVADYIGLPLIAVCGVFLIATLPPQTDRSLLPWWSPMSAGSWGLSAFGGFSAVGFVGVLAEDGWLKLGRWTDDVVRFHTSMWAKPWALGRLATAYFLGSYTGVLPTSTNQTFWADSTWLGALFLASAISMGLAAVVLLARWKCRDVTEEAIGRLERADAWAIVLELALLTVFTLSLRGTSGMAFTRYPGMLIPLFVVPVGLVLPLVLRHWRGGQGTVDAALLVLLGGFVLRMAVVGIPPSLRLTHR